MSDTKQLINRIHEIIDTMNKESIGGRDKNYFGGKISKRRVQRLNNTYNFIDPEGTLRYAQPPTGLNPELPLDEYSTCYGTGYEQPKKRKPRSDKGTKRQPSDWIKLVKAVQNHYGVSYAVALKNASKMKKDGYSHKDFE